MAFMISKETENVQSSEEIENAFRAITSQEGLRDSGGALQQPVQGDGGLLQRQDETLRGSQDRPEHHRCSGLHGIHYKIILLDVYCFIHFNLEVKNNIIQKKKKQKCKQKNVFLEIK